MSIINIPSRRLQGFHARTTALLAGNQILAYTIEHARQARHVNCRDSKYFSRI